MYRASDRVRKKIRNYVEFFRDIMQKKALIMRKITSFCAAKITLPPKPTFCSKANFKQKKRYLGLSKKKILQSYPQVYRFNIIINIVSSISSFNTVSPQIFTNKKYRNQCWKELVSRPIAKRGVERLEVKNCWRSEWCVFVVILGEKLLQNNQFLWNFCLWGW